MKTILICGGRDYNDRQTESMEKTLQTLMKKYKRIMIVSGGASGADSWARYYANKWLLEYKEYPAEWDKHGRAAGSIRNQRMLNEGKPDLVLAFPGGRGTADMVRRAKKAGVKVIEVKS